jgi:hypothetical protein
MADFGRSTADFPPVLIAALAGGLTVAAAAKKAKLSERTVYRRLQDPAFRTAVSQACGAMLSQAIGLLAASAVEAVSTLKEALADEDASVRIRAARSVLELGQRLRQQLEFEERLFNLETRRGLTTPIMENA